MQHGKEIKWWASYKKNKIIFLKCEAWWRLLRTAEIFSFLEHFNKLFCMERMCYFWRRNWKTVFFTTGSFWYTSSLDSFAAVTRGRWKSNEMRGRWRYQQSCGSLSSSSYFVRTCRMFTEEFLSSGPTHWSIRIPSLYSPLRRPSNVSTENSGGFQSGWVTGHPPSDSKTIRRGASPSFRIWAARKDTPRTIEQDRERQASYVQRNSYVCSYNDSCRGKIKRYTFSEWVFVVLNSCNKNIL